MTTRREGVIAGALGAIAPALTFAQATRPRIGMLSSLPLEKSLYASAIVQRLGELGFRQDTGMVLEFRSPGAGSMTFETLASELVRKNCDLIFAVGAEAPARSLHNQKSSIPIVFLAADYDPLEKGLVASLARPGGSITGVTTQAKELVAKRIEILKETVPAARRFLVLTDPSSRDQVPAIQAAGQRSRIDLIVTEIAPTEHDFEGVFKRAMDAGAEGLVVPASALFSGNAKRLAALAAKHRLPSIGFVGTAEAGFLLTYSVDNYKLAARAAEIGVRILKDAVPAANIPVQQPSEFVLVVNLNTAKSLVVKIPYTVLTRATKLIE